MNYFVIFLGIGVLGLLLLLVLAARSALTYRRAESPSVHPSVVGDVLVGGARVGRIFASKPLAELVVAGSSLAIRRRFPWVPLPTFLASRAEVATIETQKSRRGSSVLRFVTTGGKEAIFLAASETAAVDRLRHHGWLVVDN